MKNAIVITNVDSLLGYAVAYRFLEDWNREEQSYNQLRETTEFRLLCHERQGLEDLERLGGKIFEIENFADERVISHIMKGVYYLVFIPEFSDRRLSEGEAVLTGAKDENVDYVAMFSYVGIDQLDKHKDNGTNHHKFKNLGEFHQLEKTVQQFFDKDSYCIFRSTVWNQFFYYFGPMIEDENKIKLPVKKSTKFGSIDLADLVDAVYNLSHNPESFSNNISSAATGAATQKQEKFNNLGQLYVSNLKKKNQTVFEFTPRHNFTAEQLVEYASKGLEREDMTYEKVDSAKLYGYLYHIHNDNRFRARPIQHANDIFTASSATRKNSNDDDNNSIDLVADRPYTFPLGQYLNENQIKTIIEFWDLIELMNSGKTTDDLEKALDRKPQDVYHFFKRNKDQFRHLR